MDAGTIGAICAIGTDRPRRPTDRSRWFQILRCAPMWPMLEELTVEDNDIERLHRCGRSANRMATPSAPEGRGRAKSRARVCVSGPRVSCGS